MSKHIILFLATNPFDTGELALGREARAIQEELERSGHRDRFEFVTRWAVQPLDLIRELRRLKPTVVHFSGHGGHGGGQPHGGPCRDVVTEVGGDTGADDSDYHAGLLFQGLDGQPQFVTVAALRETFGAAGTSVRLVVLNVCYSGMQAEALLVHVDCVVVVGCSLREEMARAFAIGFYGGLGERQSVAAAYLQGCAAMSLEEPSAFETPQLRVRDGVDADRLILAEINVVNQQSLPAPADSLTTDHLDQEILELRRQLRERISAERRQWWMPAALAVSAAAMALLVLLREPLHRPDALHQLALTPARFADRRFVAPPMDARYREYVPSRGDARGRTAR